MAGRAAKIRILGRFYARQAWRRRPHYPLLVMLVSLFLLSATAFPPIGGWLGSVGFPVDRTVQLRLSGTVSNATTSGVQPAAGVKVAVGGFSTTTDSGGRFNLLFRSLERTSIPVVVGQGSRRTVRELDFAGVDQTARLDVVLQ